MYKYIVGEKKVIVVDLILCHGYLYQNKYTTIN